MDKKYLVSQITALGDDGRVIVKTKVKTVVTDISEYAKSLKAEYKAREILLRYSYHEEPQVKQKKYHVTGAELRKQSPTLIHIFPIKLNVKTADLEALKKALIHIHKVTAIESLTYCET